MFNWMNCGPTRASGQESQEVWIWVAMDATTKIVPVIQLGPGTLEMAYAVVHELCERMRREVALPVFSSDGLRLYFYALTAHFGYGLVPEGGRQRGWQLAADFIYGQVKKLQRRRRLVKVERVMLCGNFDVLARRLKAAGLSGRLNTAFVEFDTAARRGFVDAPHLGRCAARKRAGLACPVVAGLLPRCPFS